MAATVNDLKLYIELGKNILLRGKHGVGKTQMLMQACSELSHPDGSPYKMIYFSASTLDPFTDLVGIPHVVTVNGMKDLESVRPHVIDEADVCFFDEVNRAEPKTTNALMEITQFQTINGQKLSKLKSIIAAMNPADEGDYQVSALDPAFADRFSIYIDMEPKPDWSYLTQSLSRPEDDRGDYGFKKGDVKKVISGIRSWYKSLGNDLAANSCYISPRRIEDIAHTYLQLDKHGVTYAQKQMTIENMMPQAEDFAWPHGALVALLAGDPTQNPDNEDYDFSKTNDLTFIREKADIEVMKKWFVNNPGKRENIIKAMAGMQRPDNIAVRFAPILAIMVEDEIKDMTSTWGSKAKYKIFATAIQQVDDKILSDAAKQNIVKWLEA